MAVTVVCWPQWFSSGRMELWLTNTDLKTSLQVMLELKNIITIDILLFKKKNKKSQRDVFPCELSLSVSSVHYLTIKMYLMVFQKVLSKAVKDQVCKVAKNNRKTQHKGISACFLSCEWKLHCTLRLEAQLQLACYLFLSVSPGCQWTPWNVLVTHHGENAYYCQL